MILRIHERGAKLAIVAGRSMLLKGKGQWPSYENMDGVHVYRLYRDNWEMLLFPRRHFNQVLRMTELFEPDLIFCCGELNMRLALMLQKHFDVPIVLMVEQAGRFYSGEGYSAKMNALLSLIGIPVGKKFWPWLCSKVCIAITCHPRDKHILEELSQFGATVYYAPWPTHIPVDFKPQSSRNRYRGVYAGSLNTLKNTQEFEWVIPRILEETPTKEFVAVGIGPHAKVLKDLQRRTHGSVRYLGGLPRNEALRLTASSFYAYTPVKTGGWGFIGDCWSVGTPVVMTHNDGFVTDRANALVADNTDDLIRNINRLYEEPELYDGLRRKGYQESEARKAETVGDALYDIFAKAIENRALT